MIASLSYASIALIDFRLSGQVSLVTVSATEQECVPSGAWNYSSRQSSEFLQVLEGRLLIILGNQNKSSLLSDDLLEREVTIFDFVTSASKRARDFLDDYDVFVKRSDIEYADYMSVKPKERKLLPKLTKRSLVRPIFFDWPSTVNLDEASHYLESLGKFSHVQGTPSEMEKVISASRVLKLFIDAWRSDELERSSRSFIQSNEIRNLLLPETWLSMLTLKS